MPTIFLSFMFILSGIFIPIFINALFNDTKRYADDIKDSKSVHYTVSLLDKKLSCVEIIGASSSYIFLYSGITKDVLITPISNVKYIEPVLSIKPTPYHKRVRDMPKEDFDNMVSERMKMIEQWNVKYNEVCNGASNG